MKVCFVSHWSGSGGAEKVLFTIATLCRAQGIEVVCVVPKPGSLESRFVKLGIPTYRLPYRWWMGKDISLVKRLGRNLLNPFLALAVARIVHKERCDVVYTNTSTIYVGALAAWLARRPHVWHIHEYGYEHGGMTFDFGTRLSMALVDKLSDRVVTVSNGIREKYSGFLDPSKIVTVYNPIEITRDVVPEHREERRRFRVTIVGTLSEGKGQEHAILALEALNALGVDSELVVIGDGEDDHYKRRLRHTTAERGLEDRVHFRGHMADPYPAMASSDCILSCSRFEGFATVVIEGMLLNRLVVAARSGGVPEQIVDGHTGFTYEPGDIGSVARILKTVHDEPERTAAMAAAGHAWAAREFTKDQFFLRFNEVLSNLNRGLDVAAS